MNEGSRCGDVKDRVASKDLVRELFTSPKTKHQCSPLICHAGQSQTPRPKGVEDSMEMQTNRDFAAKEVVLTTACPPASIKLARKTFTNEGAKAFLGGMMKFAKGKAA